MESIIDTGKVKCLIYLMNPIDPLHPYHDDEVNILGNVKTINLIIRGLPRNVLNHMKNFECAYTLWKDLEKRYLDYSLKPLDIIF